MRCKALKLIESSLRGVGASVHRQEAACVISTYACNEKVLESIHTYIHIFFKILTEENMFTYKALVYVVEGN